jgi:hypothetical protein
VWVYSIVKNMPMHSQSYDLRFLFKQKEANLYKLNDPFAEYKFMLEAVDCDFLEDSDIQKILSK